MQYNTETTYVWICDPYHEYYPEYVKILEVLEDGKYKVLVERGPVIIIKEDQLSDSPGL